MPKFITRVYVELDLDYVSNEDVSQIEAGRIACHKAEDAVKGLQDKLPIADSVINLISVTEVSDGETERS